MSETTGNENSDSHGVLSAQLDRLQEEELRVWHRMEMAIQRHGHKMAITPPVAESKILEAVEEFREVSRVIADGIRELTGLIREEIRIHKTDISVEDLATQVDSVLKEKIEFHFKPYYLPPKGNQE